MSELPLIQLRQNYKIVVEGFKILEAEVAACKEELKTSEMV